jgi:hypothetical protein
MNKNGAFYIRTTLGVFLLIGFVYGSSRYYPRYHRYNVSGFFDVNDSNSVTPIDKMNSYYIMQDILYLTHKIEDDADNRIHLEFHVGGGMNFDSENDTTNLLGAISFKLNLFNPKIPNARGIVADINELRNLIEITGFELSGNSETRINGIYDRLEKYNSEFWWKRLSVGVSAPIINIDYSPNFDFKKSYLFLGYDFGDVLTLQVGMNTDKEMLIAVSVDLSTPLYSFAEDFKNMISRLLKLPGRRGYDYYY